MARLNIKQKARLHNKFYLELTDARTGEVKQKGWAYNLILQQGLERALNIMTHDVQYVGRSMFSNGAGSNVVGFFAHICLGEGTGVLSADRTALFDPLAHKLSGSDDYGVDLEERTAFNVRKAQWSEAQIQNTSITEVGLGDGNGSPSTHALIEDSEGNPIVVEKGEFDVLTVYATVFAELDDHGISNTVHSNDNVFLNLVGRDEHGTRFNDITYLWEFGKSDDPVDESADNGVKDLITTLVVSRGSVSVNNETLTATTDTRRLAVESGNDPAGIREIAVAIRDSGSTAGNWLFRGVFPISGVFEEYESENEELGMGDNTQTVFTTQWGDIAEDSETVKVDGATQTKGTDYTIDYATGEITFMAAPGDGLAVTATYTVEYIPKDENHVLDVSCSFRIADANA